MFIKILSKYLVKIIIIFVTGIMLLSSFLIINEKRTVISSTIKQKMDHADGVARYMVNPLKQSERQIPPDKIEDLLIEEDANIKGQWSAPIDWNVTAIHSILLPDTSVMTFGSFGIEEKENKDIRSNKKITLTDGRKITRDEGSHQWSGHQVNSSIDFDIWNQKDGFKDETHQLFKKPVVMDAFCSVVRVLDLDRVFILGGNKNLDSNLPDTQNATMIYNVKDKKFEISNNLNSKRWYGSVVRTGDDQMIIMGGKDAVTGDKMSIVPEVLDLKNFNKGWSYLNKAKSEDLFGGEPNWGEWFYPRAFLASDGNVVGISYNKIWVMDSSNDYRISKTGEIPLVTSGISRIMEHKKPHKNGEKENVEKLKLLTIGSAVGAKNSVVMIEKDKILVFGGRQYGDEYSPSNKVFSIDFSNSFKPKIKEINAMNFARSQGDATILPNGSIFLNGGHSYNNLEFSNFIPEIYNPNTEISNEMNEAYFRRNYHSTSLLLPNGTILTAGGDVWNAEIFYPPYLFEKDIDNKSILAKRTEIIDLKKNLKRGKQTSFRVSEDDVSRVTLISTGSTTHAQGSESKFRELQFINKPDNKIEINLTSNSNDIQNGTYMLFVMNSKGVPSTGKIVYIN
jgi:hypothetical protein